MLPDLITFITDINFDLATTLLGVFSASTVIWLVGRLRSVMR